MLIRKSGEHPILPSEITPRAVFERRREIVRAAAAAALLPVAGPGRAAPAGPAAGPALDARPSPLSIDEPRTPYEDVTGYNNFYEFGTGKGDPAAHAHRLQTRPWSVRIEGAVAKPGVYDIEKLLALAPLEERVYRMRCVEGWSMVIPWVGYSLSELIRRVEPLGNAHYIEYETLADDERMPGIRAPILAWPYVEGLRMDEAMHPLTLLCFGLYGEVLPNQNGAPVRIVVPWKYGFKSAKSIVAIRFVEKQPMTSWHMAAPREYGFYSNVNPEVAHPRWSQATERRIGEDGFFTRKRKTLMFNGYADQVASLYAGMDLRRYY